MPGVLEVQLSLYISWLFWEWWKQASQRKRAPFSLVVSIMKMMTLTQTVL